MKLSAVTLARVLAHIDTYDLNPKGTVFLPNIVAGLVERFKFQKYPTKLEELDEQKGIDFFQGNWNGINVDKFTIYNTALLVDTRSSTDDSERVLGEALAWAADTLGLVYRPEMISQKRFLSGLTFYSDVPILQVNPAVSNLCEKLTYALMGIVGEARSYAGVRMDLDIDRFEKQIPIAAFSVQRRANTPLSDNKYFSEAPLPTNVHVTLLEEFEAETSRLWTTAVPKSV